MGRCAQIVKVLTVEDTDSTKLLKTTIDLGNDVTRQVGELTCSRPPVTMHACQRMGFNAQECPLAFLGGNSLLTVRVCLQWLA